MGTLIDKLYYLDIEVPHQAAVAVSDGLWHQRLGHVNMSTIGYMHTNSLVMGADLSTCKPMTDHVCEPCVKGKMARLPFKSEKGIRSRGVLDLVHSDLCGPMPNESNGGSRYFLTFIDDYSRYAHVYFLKEKSEVFTVFQEYKALVENETGRHIRVLRTDGGGLVESMRLMPLLIT